MHYSTKLQAEVDHKDAQIASLLGELQNMRDFLQSEKFRVDPTIQTSDVMAMLDSIRSNHIDLSFEPWGWSCEITYEKETRLHGWRNIRKGM